MSLFSNYLDHGFYQISAKQAKCLGEGTLPRHGMERLVVHEGKKYILARTPVNGEMVWSIRECKNW